MEDRQAPEGESLRVERYGGTEYAGPEYTHSNFYLRGPDDDEGIFTELYVPTDWEGTLVIKLGWPDEPFRDAPVSLLDRYLPLTVAQLSILWGGPPENILLGMRYAATIPGLRSLRLLGYGDAGPDLLVAAAHFEGQVDRIAARWSSDYEGSDQPAGLQVRGDPRHFVGRCAPTELVLFGRASVPPAAQAAYTALGQPAGVRATLSVDYEAISAWVAAEL